MLLSDLVMRFKLLLTHNHRLDVNADTFFMVIVTQCSQTVIHWLAFRLFTASKSVQTMVIKSFQLHSSMRKSAVFKKN